MTKEELEKHPQSKKQHPTKVKEIIHRTVAELEYIAELEEKINKIRNYLAYDIPHELMNEATNKIWRMI